MSYFMFLLMQFAIIAFALVGGVFLAFSDFIMRSLSITGGSKGVETMQTINREVFRWVFMALFMSLAVVSVLLTVYAGLHLSGLTSVLISLSGLVYLIGCFGVTIFCNVPMNEALAGMDISSESTNDYWIETYLPRWTFWNTMRTGACAVSAILLLLGLLSLAPTM